MGAFKEILTDALPALEAVQKKIEALPEAQTDGYVEELKFSADDNAFMVVYVVSTESDNPDADDLRQFHFVIDRDDIENAVQCERSEYALMHGSLDLSEHIPELMEELNG